MIQAKLFLQTTRGSHASALHLVPVVFASCLVSFETEFDLSRRLCMLLILHIHHPYEGNRPRHDDVGVVVDDHFGPQQQLLDSA